MPKPLWQRLLLQQGFGLIFYLFCHISPVASAPIASSAIASSAIAPSAMTIGKQVDKPITILTSHVTQLGYIAAARTVAHIVAEQFPGRRIRLIVDYDQDKVGIREKFNRIFHFPDQVEILYLPGKGRYTRTADSYNPEDRLLAQQWLDESSLVIIALNFLGRGFDLPSGQCLFIAQIGTPASWTGLPCQCRYRVNLGLGPDEDGMLLEPQLLKKAEHGMPLAFTDDFNRAMVEYPELAHFINLTRANSSGSTPRYYMAYQHVSRNFAEFIAIASHLEGDSAEAWILSNMDDTFLESQIMTEFLIDEGVGKLIYYPPSASPRETILKEDGRVVHFARLPFLKDDLYYALFAYSQPVVGVTSNHSLFIAMTLEKLPIYLPYTPLQNDVNRHLSQLDRLFRSLFISGMKPAETARIILANQTSIASWSKNIVALKSANAQLISMIEHYEGRRGSLPASVNQAFKGGDCQWPMLSHNPTITNNHAARVIPANSLGGFDDIYYLARRVIGLCYLALCVYGVRAIRSGLTDSLWSQWKR
ncbi:hypothetical protein NX722_02010 [Endozoicomonas gorgoniicola]|uniref:Uncharacterized protein n=1 Tax=Endozoicomonas gorgoniicola TaxID=1234144 RepID=A0ABT3MPY3_9GAMM|nr:hypothetical protein [Endozoicomonas gorgoniicola]MCW7551435.1 hypothetical protein [Endozoicomonas gorgoniicola]